jgi:hypothetical protein
MVELHASEDTKTLTPPVSELPENNLRIIKESTRINPFGVKTGVS